ncbi:gamma carbonic anhydrase family protein [Solemya velesiana gill symbiont]|uniref:Gamma carbonic anhydrase family protein n=1 Tax=Solemya velesiana gill symbiont TaxID=1918948 RepID=A0A1T2KV25_9GAMM|nr:gamma carbonic anhydrase family protein [Solemya velesiana gill symbiont]OOZ36590.1 gamma carbonic anhydrase family protein [Solemya velesiana gill symbiont]
MSNIRPFDGMQPKIADDAWVDDSAVVIGDVEIGSDSSIWPLTAVRGDIHAIRIGERTNIQDGSVLHVTHDSRFNPGGFSLNIGNDVTVGHKVMLHGCTIGDHCLVGMGAIVMDGAVVESRVILAAGSLVPGGKVLESGCLYRGSPAKKVRELSAEEHEFLDYVAGNYVNLAAKCRDQG